MSEIVNCQACGYLTNSNENWCPRCRAPIGPPAPLSTQVEQVPYGAAGPPPQAPGPGWQHPPPAYPFPPAPQRAAPRAGVPPLLFFIVGAVVIGLGAVLILAIAGGGLALKSPKDELKDIVENQPDFMGKCEGRAGTFVYKGRIARQGGSFAMELEMPRSLFYGDPSFTGATPVLLIAREGRPYQIVSHENQAYIEVPRRNKDAPADPWTRLSELITGKDTTVTRSADSDVFGHPVAVYIVSDKENEAGARVYVANDLQDAIIGIEVSDDWTDVDGAMNLKLRDVTKAVDEDMFRFPVTYEKFVIGSPEPVPYPDTY